MNVAYERANKRMSEWTEVHGKKLYCANRMFDVDFSVHIIAMHCVCVCSVCTRFDTWSIAKMQQLQSIACKLTLLSIFWIDEAINCATLSKHQSNGKSSFWCDFVRTNYVTGSDAIVGTFFHPSRKFVFRTFELSLKARASTRKHHKIIFSR